MIRRIVDVDHVRRVFAHPDVWPWLVDDLAPAPAPDQWRPLDPADVIYLGTDQAVWMAVPTNSVTWDVHSAVLPEARGARAVGWGIEAARWMFNHGARKLTTSVPADNRAALAFARRCGFRPEGINRLSWLKGGRMLDQHLLGMTEAEARRL